ncbi:glucan 1,3-beta-glucosidase [Entomortierella parvispora]|uniref:glucan 1,3-beta-glucosidase n=1 Tax=Entomortierella parvispora TaxID=205924 RepID=A0A9P3HIU7_9FUNG|nr:glucan 1,3-beta-glucosidase [Entomortierella parvispora]
MEGCQDNRSCLRRHQWKIRVLVLIIIAAAVAISLAIVKPWNNNHSTNNTAKVNAYTPALNELFDYQNGTDKMRGVNLGGWLILEPFITPSLFNPYIANGIVDEWTLCQHLGLPAATALLDNHYNTWVTEDTFIRIRDLGLNHVRIPIGFWAMGNLVAGEPYVPNLSWKYLLRAIEWARKYGIRVIVELHAAPGSQNGWDHSGKAGAINWIKGTNGAANAQRTLLYLQQMSTFFASSDHAHVIPIMGLLNEPVANSIGLDKVKAWYTQALAVVRAAGGGAGKGPWAIIHDGFLETHNYVMFDESLKRMNRTAQLAFACQTWGSDMTTSTKTFGPTMVGEFTVAVKYCTTYLNGISAPPNVPYCQNDTSTFDAAYKTFLGNFFNAQVDAFEQGAGWFFWNFKTESMPLWSYFDGVDNGWIPKDANNRGPSFCATNGYPVNVTKSE